MVLPILLPSGLMASPSMQPMPAHGGTQDSFGKSPTLRYSGQPQKATDAPPDLSKACLRSDIDSGTKQKDDGKARGSCGAEDAWGRSAKRPPTGLWDTDVFRT